MQQEVLERRGIVSGMSFSPKVFPGGTGLRMRQTLMVDYARRNMAGGILIASTRHLGIRRGSLRMIFQA